MTMTIDNFASLLDINLQGWILTETGVPVKAEDDRVAEWRRDVMGEQGKWQLCQMVGNVTVSTAFVVFNREGRHFETMVFASEQDGGDELHVERCATWIEALEQHERVVAMFGGKV
jgi:hypothetical protein